QLQSAEPRILAIFFISEQTMGSIGFLHPAQQSLRNSPQAFTSSPSFAGTLAAKLPRLFRLGALSS
ncbi:MAG: hypothetical protein AB7E10_06805, partial [Burkholderiaceae bacterium]